MGEKLENFQAVLRFVHEYFLKTGVPLSTFPMTLYVWIDTNQENCKPITGQISLSFTGKYWNENCPITEAKLFAMLSLINRLTPIYQIHVEMKGYIESNKVFIVSATEEYMKKGCA